MARLIWGHPDQKRYETGISKCVLYPMSGRSYSTGVVWNGMTAVTESPSGGEAVSVYADDLKYLELRSAEEFGATLEAYQYPSAFIPCDGSAEIIPGLSIGQQARRPFGLCFRTIVGNEEKLNDFGYKLHLIYNATVSPSEKQYQTVNDSPEAISFSWEMTTTPVVMHGYKPTSIVIVDSTQCMPDALKTLEDILYGTDETDPRLPSPIEVMDIMGGHASFFYISRPDGHVKYDGPEDVPVNFTFFVNSGRLMCYEPDNASGVFDQYLEDGHLFIQEVINGA